MNFRERGIFNSLVLFLLLLFFSTSTVKGREVERSDYYNSRIISHTHTHIYILAKKDPPNEDQLTWQVIIACR